MRLRIVVRSEPRRAGVPAQQAVLKRPPRTAEQGPLRIVSESPLRIAAESPLRIAAYVSAHGLGHAVRAGAVLERLSQFLPVRITVVAACRASIWPASLATATEAWIDEPADAGVIQSDDVTVDMAATAVALDRWVEQLPAIVEREQRRLRGGFDLVVGDVPAPAFEAAKLSGIPSVAIANFSWDWIYEELGFSAAAAAAVRGYAAADLLLRATPYGPMPAFARVLDVGIVAREASRHREQARRALGIEQGQSAVLMAFQPASSPRLLFPPPLDGRCFLLPAGWDERTSAGRSDMRTLGPSVAFVDAMAATDVVVGKPGYGLISDVEASGARFLYAARPGFPENAVLERHLSLRAGTAAVTAAELASPDWEHALERIEAQDRPPVADTGGASRAAAAVARLLGIGGAAGAR